MGNIKEAAELHFEEVLEECTNADLHD